MIDKKVFVTGSTGLVGSNLCKILAEKGYKVLALVRKSSDRSFLDTIKNLEYVEGDIKDADSISKNLKHVDYVVHCAAQVSVTSQTDNQHSDTNILGTRNLLQACVENEVKKFIHISTVAVLGLDKSHYNSDETAPYSKTGIPYSDTKIDAEKLVLSYYEDKKLNVAVLRPGFIYGKNDRNGLPYIMPYLMRNQIRWIGDGSNEIALTNVINLCNAIISSMEKDESNGNVYNITDGINVTSKEFVTELCSILGKKPPIFGVNKKVANLGAKVSEKVIKNSDFNTGTLHMFSNNFSYDISKAKKDLEYNPDTNWKTYLKESVDWYIANNSTQLENVKKYLNTLKVIKIAFSLGFMVLLAILGTKKKKK
ncbi:MAG: SDR family NAD(P)-dependent oxidoreductase [Candidatus Sericytochromatia bacterium]